MEKVIAADGTILASYTYDAWGNVLTAEGSLAAANPIRYRGYYFDAETGLYYLQSRYYDPAAGRFINADSLLNGQAGAVGFNLFVYCNNAPTMGFDPTGHLDWGKKEQIAFGTTVLIIGLALLLAAPTGGTSLGAGALALSSSAVFAVGGTMVVAGTALVGSVITQTTIYYTKTSKKSGKERATNKPSWVSQNAIDLSESSQRNATNLLNNKYGKGNWRKGPGTEFNQIVKWIDRCLKSIGLSFVGISKEDKNADL